jgi:hypothetical protein
VTIPELAANTRLAQNGIRRSSSRTCVVVLAEVSMHTIIRSCVPAVLALVSCASPTAASPTYSAPISTQEPAAGFEAIHAPWTDVLKAHVRGDAFDYAALKKDRAKLDAYIAALERVRAEDLGKAPRDAQFAFWIDAYNAYTVKLVVDAYPVKSIRELGDDKVSVWDRDLVPLGKLYPRLEKSKLTLNDIENKILRPTFQDARLHAAINCASVGCPPLRAEAFTAAKLDAQLDEQVKAWLGDPTRNRFDRSKDKIEVSKVFEWFAEDFTKPAGSVPAWIARFRPADADWLTAKPGPKVEYVEYDWALNDISGG